jgi:hypothetical protein
MTQDPRKSELVGASPLVHARVAGLFGVAALAGGSFTGFVGSRIVVRDDVVATSNNLVASESLFRLGLASSLVMMVAFLCYALLLYRLLSPVNRSHAMLMVAFALASVPIFMLNQVNQFAALRLASGALHDQVKLFLELHRLGNLIGGIFFGLWLYPLGMLVFRSGFLPRFLGVLLMLGSLGYLVLFVQGFMFPGSERSLWTNPFLVVSHAAELTLMLWLLFRGLNVEQWERRVRESA